MSTPMRRIRSPCCARAGHATAVLPTAAMKSRRLMPAMGTFSVRIPDGHRWRMHTGSFGTLGWNVYPEQQNQKNRNRIECQLYDV
jgi:hypothetical protein